MSTTPPQLNTLAIDVDGEVGTLTLNRPDSLNAMNPELIRELRAAASWLADDAPLRAAIVTGAGRAFSAGGDIKGWFKPGLDDPDFDLSADVRHVADVLHQAIVDLRRTRYPVIAAVNGPAAAAGLSLALACDLRIASDAATFVCAYGRIGAAPDGGLTYFLPRTVGPAKAIELMLEDPVIDARRAVELGLASEVVPADELAAAARAKAQELAAKAPHYVRMAKTLVASSLDNSLADHLQLERHGIADAMAMEDLRGGVEAFLVGGEAEFEGR
ncbi:MAG TPA: enoyl-CoA hydratase/isomerase family protein [Solirubrobacterales bacterium]|nr:enoyl-CoA hydratase/isomerase family protein [Solirubrobacterales bacterium]